MEIKQAIVFSLLHSAVAEILLLVFNTFQYWDFFKAFEATSYLLYINTIWSLMLICVLGSGKHAIKIFLAPFFSSGLTVVTFWIIGIHTIDFLTFYLILVTAGLLVIALLYSYRRSFND
jgi:hypothetical protein